MVSHLPIFVERRWWHRASAVAELARARNHGIHRNAQWHRHRSFGSVRPRSGDSAWIGPRCEAHLEPGLVQRATGRWRITWSTGGRCTDNASGPNVPDGPDIVSSRVSWILGSVCHGCCSLSVFLPGRGNRELTNHSINKESHYSRKQKADRENHSA